MSRAATAMQRFTWQPSGLLSLAFLLLLNLWMKHIHGTFCSRWDLPRNRDLLQDGDVIIGGIFSLNNLPTFIEQDFTKLPYYKW